MTYAREQRRCRRRYGVVPDADAGTESSDRLDRAFDVLADERRRHVVRYLLRNGRRCTLRELFEYHCDRTDHEPDRFELALRHTHVPELEAAGLVEHDRHSSTLRYRVDPSMEDLLAVATEYG